MCVCVCTHQQWVPRPLRVWAARLSVPRRSAGSHPAHQAESCPSSWWLSVDGGQRCSLSKEVVKVNSCVLIHFFVLRLCHQQIMTPTDCCAACWNHVELSDANRKQCERPAKEKMELKIQKLLSSHSSPNCPTSKHPPLLTSAVCLLTSCSLTSPCFFTDCVFYCV